MRKRGGERKPSRAALLGAILIKNSLVTESKRTETSLRLSAPLKTTTLRKLLTPRAKPSKSFELDVTGIWVWEHIDNRTSVESLIREFAAHQRISTQDAENSLAIFLRTLLERNLITLVQR